MASSKVDLEFIDELPMSKPKSEQMPERLSRTIIYESDYVCLYTDRVRLVSGHIIEKYHQIHYPREVVAVVIFNENNDMMPGSKAPK